MAVAFGRYELLRKIASGGMGQVYLARTSSSQGFEKLVVIKRILPHLVEDEEFLTMFLDEARLSARLNHPNLVQIFELGEANHSHYLAMEYVPGEDLRRLETAARKRRQLLPVGLVCRIIADAAAGLDYAHKVKDAQGKPLGLIHRDVSPQNILVGFDGGVKLIDFGVAKAAGRVQHTATGILKGKYPYMSPEQVEGRSIDLRSDLFALGIVFWEALTSQRLFKSESDLQTMRMISDCQIASPRQLRPELPAALDALVMKLLARDPEERFPDAASLRLALEDFVLSERLPASSAHLVAYLRELYGDKIGRDDDPAALDELSANHDLDAISGSKASLPDQAAISTQQLQSQASEARHTAGLSAVAGSGARATTLTAGAVLLLIAAAAIVLPRLLHPAPTVAPLPPIASVTPPEPAPVETPAPVDAPKPAPAELLLESDPPGAEVTIAGASVGVTPVRHAFASADARETATFRLDGFESAEAEISAADAPLLRVQLSRKKTAPAPKRKAGLQIKTGR